MTARHLIRPRHEIGLQLVLAIYTAGKVTWNMSGK